MAAALTLLLIGSVLQGALCGEFKVTIPRTIEVLNGSCVTIPCSFDVEDKYELKLDNTCKALWINYPGTVVFDSTNPSLTTIKGTLTGDLKQKDCTTTLNNMLPAYSKKYFFRLECDNVLKISFPGQILDISVKADPPRPTLTPSTLKVKDGTSVSLTCSAPAPCLSHPPNLTWTPDLGDSQETLQENPDKTKVQTSVVNFTASLLHHGETISCTATYSTQNGSTESAVTSVTADILFSPQILPSSHCTIAEAQLRCSCSTVGNPSPTLQWYLDGLPVNHSFAISDINDTGLMSNLTVDQPQEKNLSTLLCRSFNSVGSASQRFCVHSLEPQTSAQIQVLLLAVAGVSLCVNVLYTVCIALLWRARQHVKLKEEDRTYMSLNRRDGSSEYDVIAQTTPK